MPPSASHWLLALALLVSCAPPFARANGATLEEAAALLDGGAAQAAYELLAPLVGERAGDPEYDYLLGLAALELGRNTEAVLAFERVLAVEPDNAAARAQLARAYFHLQETESARREFEAVREQDVSLEVQESVARYLTAIEQITAGEGPSASFFLEFSAGYDSNVNGGPDTQQFAVPSIPGTIFRLAPSARETADGFFSTWAGMAGRNPLRADVALIGGLSAYKRSNLTETDFGTGHLDGYLGLSATRSRDSFTLIAQGNIFLVDDSTLHRAYRNAAGGMLQWTHEHDARNQFTAYLQYASLVYPEQSPRDANRYIAGVGWSHALRRRNASFYAGLYGGAEQVTDDAFDFLAYRPIGLLGGGQLALGDRAQLFATAALEWRDYEGVDPLFDEEREDFQYSVNAGLHYLLHQGWRVSPQVSWLANDSNLAINEYDRWQAFVSLRRDW
jgi:tetratricopeptide (TPR) repeat protein